jgi:hypothetical protein
MVYNDADSHLMLPSTIFWIIWTLSIFFSVSSSFFWLDVQCCYFCLPDTFRICFRAFTILDPDLTSSVFRALLFFCYTIIKTQHCTI